MAKFTIIDEATVTASPQYPAPFATATGDVTARLVSPEGYSTWLVSADLADGATLSQHGGGVGLSNVEGRLAARFDGAAHSRHGMRDGGGFRVDLTLPLLRDA